MIYLHCKSTQYRLLLPETLLILIVRLSEKLIYNICKCLVTQQSRKGQYQLYYNSNVMYIHCKRTQSQQIKLNAMCILYKRLWANSPGLQFFMLFHLCSIYYVDNILSHTIMLMSHTNTYNSWLNVCYFFWERKYFLNYAVNVIYGPCDKLNLKIKNTVITENYKIHLFHTHLSFIYFMPNMKIPLFRKVFISKYILL